MRLHLKYGVSALPLDLPNARRIDIFEPHALPCLDNPAAALRAALESPLGRVPLWGRRQGPRSAAIAVPDATRPLPLKSLLPPLLEHLRAVCSSLAGDTITIVVGGGLHPPADAAQQAHMLPEDMRGCRVIAHDAEHSPVVRCGTTSRGTPVEINAEFARADMKIVLGMVDAHQFVGFTGGAKGVIIGCGSAAAIAAHHRLLLDDGSSAGTADSNPARLDIDEAGELASVDFAVNVVLDRMKKPVAVLAGLPRTVVREAARVTEKLYGMRFADPYDVVIASCGGHPKDACLYQAQKGLATAAQCAAPGADILLAAQCGEGVGDARYYDYARRFPDAGCLMADFAKKTFSVGPHKAFLFARVTTQHNVVVQTDMPTDILAQCHLAYGGLQETVDGWLARKPDARIAVITDANSTFFRKDAIF
jgi:nickel-dependent lactate racemase